MRLIVTRLLQFARPTEYAGYVEPLDVDAVVDDCLLLVGHLLTKTRIEVRRSAQATRRPAINRQELQQVLINIIVNAIQAMPDGGTLTIMSRDRADGTGIAIGVADSGPGLTPAAAATLFEPFVTSKSEGTGLGLWISRSLVERYGGDITARNGEDGGAVFTVSLLEEPPGERR
jgi:C4-dicarboxylate-specific signal transduction histidine kinase